MKNVLKDNERLLEQAISVDIVNIVVHDHVKKLVAENEHLKQTYKQLTAHIGYLRHTQEETATLREIVKIERLLNSLNTSLDYACKYTKCIQELLIILQQTCPCIIDLGSKLMVVTSKNNDKKIRLTEHIPLSRNTPAKTTHFTNVVSNTPVLSSTGVNLLSSASGSQPQGNTINDKIQRAPSKAKKNKLEDHHRTVRPSLNKKKSVVETKAISSATNSKLNVNADLKCATCNGCLFSNNHDSCVLTYINSVNASLKSKSVKKPAKRKILAIHRKDVYNCWTYIETYRMDFTLVGNVCPLTRIATTAIVPLREPIPIESNIDKPVVTLVYSRKFKAAKKKVPVSNPKINKSLVVQIVLWYLDSGCSKHMIGDRSQLINFVQKFLGTVKFRNDHVAKIMGYGDYKIRNVTISRVYFMEGLGNNLFSMGQFNGVIERRNRTLIEVARTMLIYAQAPLFLWAEAVATACYTQNRSIIRLRHGKIPYELLHNKLPDLSFLHVFGALCYLTNDNFDDLTAMASEQSCLGPTLHEMTPATISSGLVQQSSSSTPFVPPSRKEWDLLFQLMFDKLLNPPPSVDPQAPEVIAPIVKVIPPVQAESTGSPSSTSVDQDAPSPSKSQTTPETQSAVIPQDVKEDNIDMEVTYMGNDSLFGIPILEVTSAQSSSTVSPQTIVQPDHQIPQHISKWTKDHPLDNIIGQLSRPVITPRVLGSLTSSINSQCIFCIVRVCLKS
nr:hypothetical protein [Tanacetum cinerariifolium]